MQRSEPLGYRLKRLCALPVKLQILDLSHLGYTRGLGRADRERRKRKGDSLLIFSHTKPPHVHPTSTARPPKMAKKKREGQGGRQGSHGRRRERTLTRARCHRGGHQGCYKSWRNRRLRGSGRRHGRVGRRRRYQPRARRRDGDGERSLGGAGSGCDAHASLLSSPRPRKTFSPFFGHFSLPKVKVFLTAVPAMHRATTRLTSTRTASWTPTTPPMPRRSSRLGARRRTAP